MNTEKTVKALLQEMIEKEDIDNFKKLLYIAEDYKQQFSLQISSSFYYLLTRRNMFIRRNILRILTNIGTNVSEEDKNVLVPLEQEVYYVVSCKRFDGYHCNIWNGYYFTTKEQAIKCKTYLDKKHCVDFSCISHEIRENDGTCVTLDIDINPFIPSVDE